MEDEHPLAPQQGDPVLRGLQLQRLLQEDPDQAGEGTCAMTQVKSFVEDLIDKSYDSWKTAKYDDYQFKKNNICK